MCFDRENNRQITEYPLYLHEDEKGNSEIIGRKGRKVRRLEMGGGLPSGGEPYKQLVTDSSGVAKWEDRLAYSEPEREIYSASQVEFMTQTAGTGEQYFEAVVSSIALEEGAEYRLMVDGEFVSNEYFECASMNYMGLYFGDGLLAWAEELHRYNDGTRGYCVTEEYIFLINFAPGPHDIAVYKVEETVHKIDPKYLYDTFEIHVDLEVGDTGQVCTSRESYEDIDAAFNAGKVLAVTLTYPESFGMHPERAVITEPGRLFKDLVNNSIVIVLTTNYAGAMIGNTLSMSGMRFASGTKNVEVVTKTFSLTPAT